MSVHEYTCVYFLFDVWMVVKKAHQIHRSSWHVHCMMTGVIVFQNIVKAFRVCAVYLFFSLSFDCILFFSLLSLNTIIIDAVDIWFYVYAIEKCFEHFRSLIQSGLHCILPPTHTCKHQNTLHFSIIEHSSHFTKTKTNIKQINKT